MFASGRQTCGKHATYDCTYTACGSDNFLVSFSFFFSSHTRVAFSATASEACSTLLALRFDLISRAAYNGYTNIEHRKSFNLDIEEIGAELEERFVVRRIHKVPYCKV